MKYKFEMSTAGLLTTIGVIVLGIVDLVFVLRTGTGSSVSNFLINAGLAAPMVVGAFFFVLGHLWGGMRPKDEFANHKSIPKWKLFRICAFTVVLYEVVKIVFVKVVL